MARAPARAGSCRPVPRTPDLARHARQKVAIIAALSSDVELLILDEPTSGLDPLREEVVQQEIAAEKARGRTILLSSHIMGEGEALADRVSIIRDGRMVDTGTPARINDDDDGSSRIHTDPGPVA